MLYLGCCDPCASEGAGRRSEVTRPWGGDVVVRGGEARCVHETLVWREEGRYVAVAGSR
jgi:hypothetical protein